MKQHLLTVLGYVVATFAVQGAAHFAVFPQHYATLGIMRAQPNFALGFSSMLIQGTILSVVFSRSRYAAESLAGALKIAWMFGLFLLSYIALAEAGKYAIADIPAWTAVELSSGLVQFTLIGVFLWLAHRPSAAVRASRKNA